MSDDRTVVEADLCIQDEPKVTDVLNEAYLLFADESASLDW